MRIRIHKPIYGVPITFLGKWRPFEPVYILNPDRYANEYIISPNIKPFISVSCLTTTQFRIVGSADADITPKNWKGMTKEFVKLYYEQGNTGSYKEGNRLCSLIDNGIAKVPYKRILIQKI